MIACDGVCELVILQMQNPPGTALRPLLQLAVEKRHFHKVESIKAVRANYECIQICFPECQVYQLHPPVNSCVNSPIKNKCFAVF